MHDWLARRAGIDGIGPGSARCGLTDATARRMCSWGENATETSEEKDATPRRWLPASECCEDGRSCDRKLTGKIGSGESQNPSIVPGIGDEEDDDVGRVVAPL